MDLWVGEKMGAGVSPPLVVFGGQCVSAPRHECGRGRSITCLGDGLGPALVRPGAWRCLSAGSHSSVPPVHPYGRVKNRFPCTVLARSVGTCTSLAVQAAPNRSIRQHHLFFADTLRLAHMDPTRYDPVHVNHRRPRPRAGPRDTNRDDHARHLAGRPSGHHRPRPEHSLQVPARPPRHACARADRHRRCAARATPCPPRPCEGARPLGLPVSQPPSTGLPRWPPCQCSCDA